MSSDELYDPPRDKGNWEAPDGLQQLHSRMQTALLLELHTIPLYLFPYYSMKDRSARARGDLFEIVKREMLHLALAGNIMCAIGGQPKLYGALYVPKYPTKIFFEETPLNLAEATDDNIRSFIDLEKPAPKVAGLLNQYHSIGEFYADVRKGLDALYEIKKEALFDQSTAHKQFDESVWFEDGIATILGIDAARQALTLIVEQGEGGPDGGAESHYAKFQRMLNDVPIDCHPVINDPVTSKYEGQKIHKVMLASDAAYSYLLLSIETGWSYNGTDRDGLNGNVMSIMPVISRLAEFLVTQPLENGRNAAPPFNFYAFESPKAALQQLKDRVREAAEEYPEEKSVKGAKQLVDSLFDVGSLL